MKITAAILLCLLTACNRNCTREVTPPWVQTPYVPSWGNPVDGPNPNILLVGDSISNGYTDALDRDLRDIYDVRHHSDNARNSFYTDVKINEWLNKYPSEIVVWNDGVWDSLEPGYRSSEDPIEWFHCGNREYEQHLISIAKKIKARGLRSIFVTTTQIPAGPFVPGRELELNEIANRVLPPLGVEVFDLHEVSLTVLDKHGMGNQTLATDVHFNYEGSRVLGEAIAKYIRGTR